MKIFTLLTLVFTLCFFELKAEEKQGKWHGFIGVDNTFSLKESSQIKQTQAEIAGLSLFTDINLGLVYSKGKWSAGFSTNALFNRGFSLNYKTPRGEVRGTFKSTVNSLVFAYQNADKFYTTATVSSVDNSHRIGKLIDREHFYTLGIGESVRINKNTFFSATFIPKFLSTAQSPTNIVNLGLRVFVF